MAVVVTSLHVGGLWTSDPRATETCGSIQGRLGSLFRIALPILIWGRGLEKVPYTLLAPLLPVSLPRIIPHAVDFTKKQKKLLAVALNVHTLLDRDSTARPERRTALITKELARYRIDIAALRETRLADEGILKDDGDGCTFFWCGKSEAEDRLSGVGLAVRTNR